MKSTCHPTYIATETLKRRPNKMTTPQMKIKSMCHPTSFSNETLTRRPNKM
ncbi:hypothetical protein DPMN_144550 [Dreissena polymorpha]|uniref:Uncharacterized protein n=1 Tax=Dreissena polymorpha TaxID=45954 RepID=A0A9D4GF76_DREPO|nr:hypothetical protein DPMN_144550 [Dreissena polymorpha]